MAIFNARSHTLLSNGAPRTRKKSVNSCQCLIMYEIAPPSDEFGSTSFSSNWAFSQRCSSFITGPLCSW
jgi:hypothetical protein